MKRVRRNGRDTVPVAGVLIMEDDGNQLRVEDPHTAVDALNLNEHTLNFSAAVPVEVDTPAAMDSLLERCRTALASAVGVFARRENTLAHRSVRICFPTKAGKGNITISWAFSDDDIGDQVQDLVHAAVDGDDALLNAPFSTDEPLAAFSDCYHPPS